MAFVGKLVYCSYEISQRHVHRMQCEINTTMCTIIINQSSGFRFVLCNSANNKHMTIIDDLCLFNPYEKLQNLIMRNIFNNLAGNLIESI